MAIRDIRKEGDETLRKRAREVENITPRILTLLKDMADTLYDASGAGLAAPQVGILKRVVVIDVGEGDGLIELINPVIISQEGEQNEFEGCLSIPGMYGIVSRPSVVEVEALNAKGKKFRIKGEKMLARCLSHEIDHLDGILYKDKATRFMTKEELDEMARENGNGDAK